MYLVVIHVPVFVDGSRRLVSTDWLRSLQLLRDSFDGYFGPIHVLAPWMPLANDQDPVYFVPIEDAGEDICFITSFNAQCSARSYWLNERRKWLRDVQFHVAKSDVVHSGMDDVWRPISFAGHATGVKQGKTTVFVQDTAIVAQALEAAQRKTLRARLAARLYGALFEKHVRFGVRTATVSLLKGGAMARYGPIARNANEFQDTSHSKSDVISSDHLERRMQLMRRKDVLKLVYCGRLVWRKGVDQSIEIVMRARRLGVDVRLSIIGSGPERRALEELVGRLEAREWVQLLGASEYGPKLLRRLAEYDGLLFTPRWEDTPRMVFDGFAGGLPIFGSDVSFVRERSECDRAVVLLRRGSIEDSAELLVTAFTTSGRLETLSHQARLAGECHCAENWYARRSAWTIEAHERRLSEDTPTSMGR